MALDIVEKIRQSEAEAAASVAETKAAVSKMLSDAEASGKKLLESVKAEEEKKLSAYKEALENDAKKKIEDGRVESLAQCEMTKSAAASKLDASANAVCERIIGK